MSGNDIEIRVSKKNDANLDQLGRDAKKAGKEVADGLDKGFKEGEQSADRMRKKVGADLDKTAKDAGEAGGKAGREFGTKLGEGIGTAAEGGASDVVGSLTDGMKSAGGGIAAAGIGIGMALIGGISETFENKKIAGMLAVQTGATSEEAGKLGRVAGDVFAGNFGDSMQDVADAMRSVLQNKLIDSSAAESDIKRLTELAMTASQVVGEETGKIARAARQMLVNGLAGSAEEALDIIVRASQDGLNVNEDLTDTIIEYSTKWRDLGVTGPEAMGLISQALKGGIRDTDTAADALKEFAIRAIDGSETTARGFESLGMDAQAMGDAVAAGGGTAREALRQVLNGMQNLKDPTLRAQAAVDLFGTKSEDAGRALLKMDLDTVSKEFANVAGATQKSADEITKSTPPMEAAWRDFKGVVTDTFDAISSTPALSDDMRKAIDEIAGKQRDAAKANDEYKQRVDDAAHAWERQAGSIKKATKSLAEQIQMQNDAAGVQIDIAEAEIRYQKALDDTAETLKKNGKTLDVTTEKGRDNKQALLDQTDAAFRQIEAMEKQGSTADQIRVFMGGAREEFIRTAISMGLGADQANKMADKLRLIPGNYTAVVAIQDGASNTINTIHGKLVNLTNRSWIASVAVVGGAGAGGGRYYAGLASGGAVGAGIPTAADGGARGSMFLAHEQGPEIIQQPTGSVVIPAGMSRAMMNGWMSGGGYSGGGGGRDWSEVRMTFAGDLDSLMASAWMKAQDLGLIRVQVR